jgi:hypothetical protein
MNAMGHDVKNFIGVQQRDLARAISKLVPDYHPMGSDGMAMMGEMEHPMPNNTLPMMTGFGSFGAMEMGGMFSVVKVRDGIAANDYRDPGWYPHPQGTVAYEFKGEVADPPRRNGKSDGRAPEMKAVKPKGGHGNH